MGEQVTSDEPTFYRSGVPEVWDSERDTWERMPVSAVDGSLSGPAVVVGKHEYTILQALALQQMLGEAIESLAATVGADGTWHYHRSTLGGGQLSEPCPALQEVRAANIENTAAVLYADDTGGVWPSGDAETDRHYRMQAFMRLGPGW